jgi:hypothetical protein
MSNALITIRVVPSYKGWRIEYNDELVNDYAGRDAWDNLGDALMVLRSKLEFLDLDKL